jgi:predicted transcriptional regulator|tara:strand:+ start:75 stop:398 length:324 start_codon:yes stop_codon:yes gene_type:complete
MRKTTLQKPHEIDEAINIIKSKPDFTVSSLYKIWGLLLRKKRIALNLTQTDVAKMTFVTFQQIQKFENGKNKISFDKVIMFCQQTGTGYDYFLNTLNGRTLITNIGG